MHCEFNFILLIKWIIRFISLFIGLFLAALVITQGNVKAALALIIIATVGFGIYLIIEWAWRE